MVAGERDAQVRVAHHDGRIQASDKQMPSACWAVGGQAEPLFARKPVLVAEPLARWRYAAQCRPARTG